MAVASQGRGLLRRANLPSSCRFSQRRKVHRQPHPPRTVSPGSAQWSQASGGLNPLNGNPTPAGDNTFFWAQWDFLKRQTVVTAGFVDVLDPRLRS